MEFEIPETQRHGQLLSAINVAHTLWEERGAYTMGRAGGAVFLRFP